MSHIKRADFSQFYILLIRHDQLVFVFSLIKMEASVHIHIYVSQFSCLFTKLL